MVCEGARSAAHPRPHNEELLAEGSVVKSGDWIEIGILGLITLIGAVFDLKTKKIPTVLLITGGLALAAAVPLFAQELPLRQRLLGLVPGLILLGISLWKRMIGIGDVVLILMYGWGLGFRMMCFHLLISFLCLFPVSLSLLAFRRLKRTDTIPFYPFAAIGYGLMLATLWM